MRPEHNEARFELANHAWMSLVAALHDLVANIAIKLMVRHDPQSYLK